MVFSLGDDYDYSFVSGYNRNYLWLLARTPQVSEAVKAKFVREATAAGFATDELIWLDNTAR